jgi:hypothetical protein
MRATGSPVPRSSYSSFASLVLAVHNDYAFIGSRRSIAPIFFSEGTQARNILQISFPLLSCRGTGRRLS